MSVLVLISEYSSWREVCLSACYHAIPLPQIREMFGACVNRLTFLPLRAELYLSEVADDRLARIFADRGIELSVTTSISAQDELCDLYEAKTQVPFDHLQTLSRSYCRPVLSFARQDIFAA